MVAKNIRTFLTAMSLTVLTACQTVTFTDNADSAPESGRAPAGSETTTGATDVVSHLQQQALQLQSEGRWTEAELTLERALRIDADKVDLYQQLATVRMGQGRFMQAEQIALKGLTLSHQDAAARAELWTVIAQCRSAQGNIEGARAARAEALKWQSQ